MQCTFSPPKSDKTHYNTREIFPGFTLEDLSRKENAMQISVSQEQGRVPVTVLKLDGLLNMGTSELLEEQGSEAYAAGARYLLLDMSRVTSLTSAGLRSILRISRMYNSGMPGNGPEANPDAARKQSCVKLLNPNSQIENVLTIAGFTSFLEIFRDPLEAINSF